MQYDKKYWISPLGNLCFTEIIISTQLFVY